MDNIYKRYYAARRRYLLDRGWVLDESRIPGGPEWWVDPQASPHGQRAFMDSHAAERQEMRDHEADTGVEK